nr:molecular chaperone [uncultured Cellulosilyticum sp.]
MARYSYKLYKNEETNQHTQRYTYTELCRKTTYQLKEICIKEKLVKNQIIELNREALIHLIMVYRGVQETKFIKEFEEEGIARLESLLKKVEHVLQNDSHLIVPSKIKVYEGLDVGIYDHYTITAQQILTEGNMLLVDEQFHIATIFNLHKVGNEYYLMKTKEIPAQEITNGHYFLLYFEQKESDLLYAHYYNENEILPHHITYARVPILEFKLQIPKQSEQPLVIDFGTCNTTLGIFDEEKGIQVAQVLDSTCAEKKVTPFIPSVIAVKAISEEKIDYLIGYDALRLSASNYIKAGIHVFFDIKRWISDYERMEKITSEDGQYMWIKRKDILKVYFEYILACGENYFKKTFNEIRFLTPIRQNKKFEKLFEEILEEYEVKTTLDEGVAVVFNVINGLIEKDNYVSNQTYKALIIDCGGGTTDLTACEFTINNKRVAYHINMATSYENGDTNFGGNNLTYRVMQLLKLQLVGQLQHTTTLFGVFEEEEVNYERLEQLYNQAEEVLPTQFKNYERVNVAEYFKVKQNYYYLFELAEEVKQAFFGGRPLYEMKLSLEDEPIDDVRKQHIHIDKWKLSVNKHGQLEHLNELEPIIVYRYEIYSLLRGDVYGIVQKLLMPFYENEQLMEYQLIKLTGQSCQASLFKEALKEFVPGKYLNYKKDDKKTLKLDCLYGAIKYYHHLKLGYMSLQKEHISSVFPYELTAYTHENIEKTLMYSLRKNKETGTISRFKDGMTLKLYLKDREGKVLRVYDYSYQAVDFKLTTYYEIESEYPEKIVQDETDTIENNEIKFFIWVDEIEWGFYILPILRKEEELYSGTLVFFDFENDTWEKNFFDGTK